ncbi:FecCD family ABC transporter permease [Pseudobacteriovorax antillogorgiicola]|uniref:Iron complex transport system permease protein n=1 Tax=Pseudobacteriovorax antillogorgiicola TaxID=1513793 RepID=A0A1Y6C9E7_9BACT|nr:iron ABC transporter permease [Pseudobacteriovorax antillogorgiicola]TCS49027.1 iron complex transport system permease protein [Pseudobacteriovorax antillogorgiicola]SMF52827.1 iron complex transport system permease protein [Pseudobacteriovorax antillogorgiicola]
MAIMIVYMKQYSAFFLIAMLFLMSGIYLLDDWPRIEAWVTISQLLEQVDVQLILHLRLPRLIMAICNGLLLSLAGALTQAIFKNPLAAPSLVGVSTGASLFAAFFIFASSQLALGFLDGVSIPMAAFVGASLTCLMVFRLSWIAGKSNLAILILAGVAVNAVCGALLGFLIFSADDESLRSINFWSLGSIGSQEWSAVLITAITTVIVVIFSFRFADALNAISLGESVARHLGFSVEKIKVQTIALIALSVGVSVSFCGLIGFVGLVVPHIARMIWGAENRQVLKGCVILGPSLILLADYVAKTVVFPAELPIGIVTSGVGGPFFMYLLLRYKKRGHL